MTLRRPLLAIVALAIVSTILFSSRYGLQDRAAGSHLESIEVLGLGDWINPPAGDSLTNQQEPVPAACDEDLTWLKAYQFTSPIQYASRDIITVPAISPQRPLVTKIEKPLFDGFSTINLTESQTLAKKKCLPPLKLEVPHGKLEPVDASHIIFGLQTTISRLRDTRKHLARWLPDTGARLFCIVIENEETPANDSEMRQLEREFIQEGMKVSIIHPVSKDDQFQQRYFSLVNVMYKARSPTTRWIATIDDDTFFPSMHDLVGMLTRHDASIMQYIGSLSEDWWAVNHYGLMGFGGASIILSLPLAKVLDDNVDECKGHTRTSSGDVSIMDCIYRFSPTKLTHVNALHQVDFYGDQSGFYESGREILSLHHWKGGQNLEMEKMHLVADVCDNCFLQRWQFPKDLLLSNGYSITHYPLGHLTGKSGGFLGIGAKQGIGAGEKVEKIDLREMEDTWNDDLNVAHSLGPLRPKMPEGGKVSYKLLDSIRVTFDPNGGRKHDVVRQVYFKEGTEGESDTVMVLNWHAGRRQESRSEIKAVEHKKDLSGL